MRKLAHCHAGEHRLLLKPPEGSGLSLLNELRLLGVHWEWITLDGEEDPRTTEGQLYNKRELSKNVRCMEIDFNTTTFI